MLNQTRASCLKKIDGHFFPATLQVWRYDEGDVTHVGVGHSGEITGVKISPDGQHIVSVSSDGAIMRWVWPVSPQPTPIVPPLELPAESATPREDPGVSVETTPAPEAVTAQQEVVTPKLEVAKVASPSIHEGEMVVGGASPKQEE